MKQTGEEAKEANLVLFCSNKQLQFYLHVFQIHQSNIYYLYLRNINSEELDKNETFTLSVTYFLWLEKLVFCLSLFYECFIVLTKCEDTFWSRPK